ncbi:hypothetical protein [Roseivirga pacifica]|uniref:hypothetical protein n=1 Tax=Roseivirga pacifica TaxID=1267423 RepID=UPI003BA9B30B
MKLTKYITLTVCLSALCFIIVAQSQTSGPIFQLSKSYPSIKIDDAINQFGQQLVKANILRPDELKQPSAIYNTLEEVYLDLSPTEFNIPKIIDKAALNELLSSQDVLNTSEVEQAKMALFTYYQLVSENYRNFTFHLQEERLIQYQNRDLPINSLESVIFEEIQKRSENGVTVNNAKLTITADEYTDIEFVNFIMTKFREMGIRQVGFGRNNN